MEEERIAERQKLRELMQESTPWTNKQLAELTGRSVSWVKKWKKRLAGTRLDDMDVLKSHSRRPVNVGSPISQRVIDGILEIRDNPPENLRRIPGPKAIVYYLHRHEELQSSGDYLPTSTSTIWKILDENQRIWRDRPRRHEAVERPAPMLNLQMDFKDVTTVSPTLDGRKVHAVEVLNVVDVGTSVLLSNHAREDYNAETSIDALATTFREWGLPQKMTFDRDPRFVGAAQSRDFPAAMMRFLLCLGVEVDVCPPQRPDLNAFVERFNGTYEHECVQRYKPNTLEETRELNQRFYHHYNFERPNQAITCGNQPPRTAFPRLPVRPTLPEMVDPDRWIRYCNNKPYTRRVNANGAVKVNKDSYYIGRQHRGRTVLLRLISRSRHFRVELDGQILKHIPIKGLHHLQMRFHDYLELIKREAFSEWRRYLSSRVTYA